MSGVFRLQWLFTRRVLLIVVGLLFISGGMAVALQTGDAKPAPHQAVQKPTSKPAATAATTPPPASAPANATAPPSTTAPAQTAQNKAKPSTAQPAPASSGYPWGMCTQMVANLYPSYNADIKVEYVKHQQLLAELQQAYDSGEYYDPDTGASDYNAYQADVQDENARFNQASLAVQNKYNGQLNAAGCTQSRI